MIWLTLGGIIVVVLAAYAGWLHYRLWKQKTESNVTRPRSGEEANLSEKPLASHSSVDVSKSIYLIADAMLDNKMTHTEACLRICALSNHLPTKDTFLREYGVLFTVAEATAHFPILDEWQALDREQKKSFTQERQNIETKYADAVVEAVTRVKLEFTPG